jgi:gamma-glutamyl:cysteine ligase YbdK (ATP-grasp superfamily)
MGRDIQAIKITGEDRRKYRDKVRRSLDAFARMLREQWFDDNPSMVGQEIELNLTDDRGMPAMRNDEALDAIADPVWATEVGQFNLEINVPPRHLGGDAFGELEREVRADLNAAEGQARTIGTHLVMIGILPTLAEQDVNEDTMSANERYKVLNEQIFAARGEDMQIAIDGTEQLLTHADSITPEAACTSVQLHTQVSPDGFANYWNAAQAIAGVQVALGANSPFLFGKQLWHETRITLFEQATDTRPDELKEQGVRPRVWFGERWITSVFDLFEENLRYFPALLPICEEEDPLAALDAGISPQFPEMSLHNGTIYRWNRPVYGVVDGTPHLRVENRVLPAGPTIADVMANAAFYYGLVRYLAEAQRPIWTQMSFATAAENLHEAARHGLDAQLYWPGVGDTPAAELILRRLLPLAREGLARWDVSPAHADRLLGIVEQRCLTGQTGAAWQIATVARLSLRDGLDRPEALRQMTQRYIEHMHSNEPVHTWSVDLTSTTRGDESHARARQRQPGQPQPGQPLAQYHPRQHDRTGRVERGQHRGDGQEAVVRGEEVQGRARRPGDAGDDREPGRAPAGQPEVPGQHGHGSRHRQFGGLRGRHRPQAPCSGPGPVQPDEQQRKARARDQPRRHPGRRPPLRGPRRCLLVRRAGRDADDGGQGQDDPDQGEGARPLAQEQAREHGEPGGPHRAERTGHAERRVPEPEIQGERTQRAARARRRPPGQRGSAGPVGRAEGQRREHHHRGRRAGQQGHPDDAGRARCEPGGKVRATVSDGRRQGQDDGEHALLLPRTNLK